MNTVYLTLWIFSYTLSLLTITFGFIYYRKTRSFTLKFYLLHKLVLLGVILWFMISLLIDIESLPFLWVLFNILALMNLNMPRMIFSFSRKRGPAWLTLILPLAFQLLLNLLFFLKWESLLYPFFSLMFAPILLSSLLVEKAPGKIPLIYFWKSLPACTVFMALITCTGVGFYLLRALILGPVDSEGFHHYYFSLFYMLVNGISLGYFFYQSGGNSDMNSSQRKGQAEIILSTIYSLTPREIEVLYQLVEGCSYQAIADSCFISLSTVKKHSNSIYRKTDTRNGRQLSQWYHQLKNAP